MTEQKDEELMLLYQAHNYQAFNELYRRYEAKVYAYLKNKRLSPEEQREIFQGTFLKLHQSRHRYQQKYPFVAWLFTHCRSVWLDKCRDKKRQGFAFASDGEGDVLSPEPEARLEAVLADSGLPADTMKLLCLRFEEGLNFEEMAEVLGKKPAALRKSLSRAIQFLRRQKEEEG